MNHHLLPAPSVAKRLADVRARLVYIEALVLLARRQAKSEMSVTSEPEEIYPRFRAQISKLSEHLRWLEQVDGLDAISAPDGDQREAMDQIGGAR